MRNAVHLALSSASLASLVLASACPARAEERAPMPGATEMLPPHFQSGVATLTIYAAPRVAPVQQGTAFPSRWSQPLVDRHLDAGTRSAPLAVALIDTINRVEPIYDPTLLDGPNVVVPLHISAGTAETRDLFGDHWQLASGDANVDADVRPLATIWLGSGSPRPCVGYLVHRPHDWREPALTAPTAADCRAIRARQSRGFTDTSPLPIAIAPPPIPVFAAPEPGARMSSSDFWTAQRARIAGIHAHLHRKWSPPARSSFWTSFNGPQAAPAP